MTAKKSKLSKKFDVLLKTEEDVTISWSSSDSGAETPPPNSKRKRLKKLPIQKCEAPASPILQCSRIARNANYSAARRSNSSLCLSKSLLSFSSQESPILNVNIKPLLTDRILLVENVKKRLFSDDDSIIENSLSVFSVQSRASIRSFTPIESEHSKDNSNISSASSPSLHESHACNPIEENHQDSSKSRKKRFKRDGLAHRLQNLLKTRESAIAIWKYEQESAGFDAELPEPPLILTICESHQEFGITAMLCHHLEEKPSGNYLVISSKYFVKDVLCQIGSTITIYQPFEIYPIQIGMTAVNIIMNCCKMIL